ncbi:hypothetical protein [Halolamina pelagica]|uniref:hypothetical protein n=1 Tax=Halolamina pelagica TaxID=699431 RepID=UPI0006CA6B30|nr:hypothetical protein [Halolamina pelagica]
MVPTTLADRPGRSPEEPLAVVDLHERLRVGRREIPTFDCHVPRGQLVGDVDRLVAVDDEPLLTAFDLLDELFEHGYRSPRCGCLRLAWWVASCFGLDRDPEESPDWFWA